MDSRDWDRRWQERAQHAHPRTGPTDAVADALTGLSPGRALDLGCGAGRHAIWLAEQGWQVTAVDFSAEALRQAKARAHALGLSVTWVQADLTAYEPAAAAFDLVLVAYIHLPPAERSLLLRHATAALAPGGTLLVIGHDLANLGTGAPGPSSPAVLYSPSDVAAELSGVTVERSEQVRRRVELEDGAEVEAIDALVLARR